VYRRDTQGSTETGSMRKTAYGKEDVACSVTHPVTHVLPCASSRGLAGILCK